MHIHSCIYSPTHTNTHTHTHTHTHRSEFSQSPSEYDRKDDKINLPKTDTKEKESPVDIGRRMKELET
jgi:hypothetical protein